MGHKRRQKVDHTGLGIRVRESKNHAKDTRREKQGLKKGSNQDISIQKKNPDLGARKQEAQASNMNRGSTL